MFLFQVRCCGGGVLGKKMINRIIIIIINLRMKKRLTACEGEQIEITAQ